MCKYFIQIAMISIALSTPNSNKQPLRYTEFNEQLIHPNSIGLAVLFSKQDPVDAACVAIHGMQPFHRREQMQSRHLKTIKSLTQPYIANRTILEKFINAIPSQSIYSHPCIRYMYALHSRNKMLVQTCEKIILSNIWFKLATTHPILDLDKSFDAIIDKMQRSMLQYENDEHVNLSHLMRIKRSISRHIKSGPKVQALSLSAIPENSAYSYPYMMYVYAIYSGDPRFIKAVEESIVSAEFAQVLTSVNNGDCINENEALRSYLEQMFNRIVVMHIESI